MKIKFKKQFLKDIKRLEKRGKNVKKLEEVIKKLASGKKLELKYRDHALIGQWKNYRDCHVEPDWVLIYSIAEDELKLERTGSHSDLFG